MATSDEKMSPESLKDEILVNMWGRECIYEIAPLRGRVFNLSSSPWSYLCLKRYIADYFFCRGEREKNVEIVVIFVPRSEEEEAKKLQFLMLRTY